MKIATGLLVAVVATTSASANVVAYDSFGGDDLNLVSLTGEASYSSGGDGFQEYASGDSAPFTLIDASAGDFPTDSLGIVPNDVDGNYDAFFGAVDTTNGDNSSGEETAVWTFDVTGSTDIVVTFDLAAMGDFEDADSYTITIAVDGTDQYSVSAIADTDGDLTYTLASGTENTLSDPLTFDGETLSNNYTNFSTGNIGDGDTVTFTLDVDLDGGSEGVALDNITVNAVPEPASAALLALGTLLIARRRR